MAKNKYIGGIGITLLFLLDVLSVEFPSYPPSDTWEQSYWNANEFVMWREMFMLLLVLLLPVITWAVKRYKIRFDFLDSLLFASWAFSLLITVFDYSTNQNLRDVEVDYWAFGTVVVLLWVLKVIDVHYGFFVKGIIALKNRIVKWKQ